MGFDLASDRDDLVHRRHFQVESRDELTKDAHVAVLNVAAILAQVDGDAVSPTRQSTRRRRPRVWLGGAAGLAHRGDVIDVRPEADRTRWRGHADVVCSRALTGSDKRAPATRGSAALRGTGPCRQP